MVEKDLTRPFEVLQGVKYDEAKNRWSLIPKGTIDVVLRVLEFGAKKYAPDNWMRVPDAKTRYYDAMMRHMDAWWRGEKLDPETLESHLGHAACCLLFLMWFEIKGEQDANSKTTSRPI